METATLGRRHLTSIGEHMGRQGNVPAPQRPCRLEMLIGIARYLPRMVEFIASFIAISHYSFRFSGQYVSSGSAAVVLSPDFASASPPEVPFPAIYHCTSAVVCPGTPEPLVRQAGANPSRGRVRRHAGLITETVGTAVRRRHTRGDRDQDRGRPGPGRVVAVAPSCLTALKAPRGPFNNRSYARARPCTGPTTEPASPSRPVGSAVL